MIDEFGDTIMNCSDLGDSWRHRHDTVKLAISKECVLSKVAHDVEVYGAFSYLIPSGAEQVGGSLQWGRARQGLVPDRIQLPTPEGPSDCTVLTLESLDSRGVWLAEELTGGLGVHRSIIEKHWPSTTNAIIYIMGNLQASICHQPEVLLK